MALQTTTIPGQLSAETYAHAERLLPDNLKDLVFGLRVRPRWLKDTDRFWYTNRTPDGSETVLVDARAGTREVVSEPPEAIPQRPSHENPSPDGRWIMLRRDHNLVLRDTTTGEERQVTDDGEANHSYGTPPDVTTFRSLLEPLGVELPPIGVWSPDSSRFATHRIDQRSLPMMHLVQSGPPDGSRPRLHSYRYAMPGESDVPMARFTVIDVATGQNTPMQLDPVPVPYLSPAQVRTLWWSQDCRFLYLLRFDRAYSEAWLEQLDPETGAARTLAHERSDTYLDMHPIGVFIANVAVIGDGEDMVWWSERDGWGHLYLIDGRSGETVRQLTRGEWLVCDLVHVDEDERMVYFTAAGREPGSDPYVRGFYRVHLDTTEIESLTDDQLDHEITGFPSGQHFLDRASRWDTPPVTTVRDGSGMVVIEVERANIDLLRAEGWTPPERFTAKAADGITDIYGLLHKPMGLDADQAYPVLDDIYPGPQSNRAFVGFAGIPFFSDETSMTALGFAVVTIDGRGTPMRSKAFHQWSYGRLETAGGLEDHVTALRQLAQRYSWLNLDRVGIYGHSGGSYASVRAMLAYPEFYRVAVANSGNHDVLYYHATWGERYQGPVDGDRYVAQANASLAGNLRGKLLLIHGEMDDNVPPHLTMRLVQALIKANKDFDLLIVPNAEHSLMESKAYWLRRRWDYFVRHLLELEPPAGYRIANISLDLERLGEMFGG